MKWKIRIVLYNINAVCPVYALSVHRVETKNVYIF